MSTLGVPQGTILVPLLFLLYINDVLLDIPEDEIVSYADDIAVLTSAKTWKEVEFKINETLHKISTWLALNKLSLNTDKTVYIKFGNEVSSTPKNLDINIQGTKINRVENTKYLGIIFDSHMTWNEHCEYIYNKTKYLIFVFYKSKLMTTDTLRMISYAISQYYFIWNNSLGWSVF